jgi:3'(2'), 5'-bisphosphate nucleotidase
MSFFNKSQTEKIVSFALKAGEIAVDFFNKKNFETRKKADNSQVTSADVAVSKFLYKKLTKEFPSIPVVCEEGELRDFQEEIFWLIDPIDGTSSFVSGSVEFSISIGLVINKKSVFGLIYAPLFENGKMVFSDEKNQIIFCDNLIKNKILRTPKKLPDSKLRIITSTQTKYQNIENYLSQIQPDFSGNFVVEKLSSAAIKFFRLLEGDADIYLNFHPCMEWDSAGGQALIELMNGKVKNLFFNQSKFTLGEDVFYKKLGFKNQGFLAFVNSPKL